MKEQQFVKYCRNTIKPPLLYGRSRLFRFLTGSVPPPSFLSSMPLDDEAARLISRWSDQEACWHDPKIVLRFEQAFARRLDIRHAVSFGSGRAAWLAILLALGVQDTDEVLIPGYTCIVVDNAVRATGARPVHVDIELDSYGPDVEDVARKITPRSRCLLLHHLYGLPARDTDEILELARERKISLVEDAAQSLPALWRGRPVGSLGEAGFFSFELSKCLPLVAGGMAVTNDNQLAERIRNIRETFAPFSPARIRNLIQQIRFYAAFRKTEPGTAEADWLEASYAASYFPSTTVLEVAGQFPDSNRTRLPAPLADLGTMLLSRLDQWTAERKANSANWQTWCSSREMHPPVPSIHSEPSWLRYPVRVDPELKTDRSWARDLGIPLGDWFRTPLHPSSRNVKNCPRAEEATASVINFPTLGNHATPPEQRNEG